MSHHTGILTLTCKTWLTHGWLVAACWPPETRNRWVVSRIRFTQAVSHPVCFLGLTCFPHDLADVSEQQSYFSLFVDWQEPKKGKRVDTWDRLVNQCWSELFCLLTLLSCNIALKTLFVPYFWYNTAGKRNWLNFRYSLGNITCTQIVLMGKRWTSCSVQRECVWVFSVKNEASLIFQTGE